MPRLIIDPKYRLQYMPNNETGKKISTINWTQDLGHFVESQPRGVAGCHIPKGRDQPEFETIFWKYIHVKIEDYPKN